MGDLFIKLGNWINGVGCKFKLNWNALVLKAMFNCEQCSCKK